MEEDIPCPSIVREIISSVGLGYCIVNVLNVHDCYYTL